MELRLEAALRELITLRRALERSLISQDDIAEQLQQTREQRAGIWDFAPVGLLMLTDRGIIQEINVAACDILEATRDQLLGSLFFLRVAGLDHVAFQRHMIACGRAGEVVRTQLKLGTQEHRQIPVELVSLPVAGAAGGQLYRTAIIDLRERKRIEAELHRINEELAQRTAEAEMRSEQLRDLAWELSRAERSEQRRLAQLLHDSVQQILVAARMKIEQLGAAQSAEQRAADIQRSSDLINEAVHELRTLSAQLCPPVLYDMGLIPALGWLARQMEARYGLRVQIEADNGAEPDDDDSRALVFQVVNELLFNVIKHAGTDHARVTVTPSADDKIAVVVADNGRGCGEHDLVRESDQKGPGLGIRHMRYRLNLIGGCLTIQSTVGLGTRATITVPTSAGLFAREQEPPPPDPDAPDSDEAAREQQAPSEQSTRRRRKLKKAAHPGGAIRVMLVDDHSVVRRGLASVLAAEPDIAIVAEAADGTDAIEMARSNNLDVILMDVSMPTMNGIEATRRIKADHPDVTVIGLSMHETDNAAEAMKLAGAAAYFTKDGSIEKLTGAIRRFARPHAPTEPAARAAGPAPRAAESAEPPAGE